MFQHQEAKPLEKELVAQYLQLLPAVAVKVIINKSPIYFYKQLLLFTADRLSTAGWNSPCQRETPSWQKPITNFFNKNEDETENKPLKKDKKVLKEPNVNSSTSKVEETKSSITSDSESSSKKDLNDCASKEKGESSAEEADDDDDAIKQPSKKIRVCIESDDDNDITDDKENEKKD